VCTLLVQWQVNRPDGVEATDLNVGSNLEFEVVHILDTFGAEDASCYHAALGDITSYKIVAVHLAELVTFEITTDCPSQVRE
jgi:hypothetical protein